MAIPPMTRWQPLNVQFFSVGVFEDFRSLNNIAFKAGVNCQKSRGRASMSSKEGGSGVTLAGEGKPRSGGKGRKRKLGDGPDSGEPGTLPPGDSSFQAEQARQAKGRDQDLSRLQGEVACFGVCTQLARMLVVQAQSRQHCQNGPSPRAGEREVCEGRQAG